MAIVTDSLDVVESKGTAAFRTRFPSRDTGPDSFLGMSARAVSMLVYNLLSAAVACDNDACPGTKTSSTALDNWATAIGLESNSGAGAYGRNGNWSRASHSPEASPMSMTPSDPVPSTAEKSVPLAASGQPEQESGRVRGVTGTPSPPGPCCSAARTPRAARPAAGLQSCGTARARRTASPRP